MKNKENKNTIKEETRKLTKLTDDQIEEVTGGVGLDIEDNANPMGDLSRTKTFEIDERVRKNG